MEKLMLGVLILASITVFIISLYIVIPTLLTGDKIEIDEERRRELDAFKLSDEALQENDTVTTDAETI